LHGVPTHFLGVLAEVDVRSRRGENVDMSSLRCVDGSPMEIFSYLSHSRTGIAAGSPVPIDLMKSLISKLNLKDLTNAYGMSRFNFFGLLFSELLTTVPSRD
jgi:hypothetical protein